MDEETFDYRREKLNALKSIANALHDTNDTLKMLLSAILDQKNRDHEANPLDMF